MKRIALTTVVALVILGSRVDAGLMNYSSTVLSQNPNAYYRLNETAGATAFDLVGGNHAAYGTALTLGQAGPRSTQFGGFEADNRAVHFDRDNFNSVLSLPTSLGMTSNLGSVSLWFNITADQAADRASFLFYGNGGNSGDGFGTALEHHVQIWADGTVGIFSRGTGLNTDLNATTTPSQGNFADGFWHQLVFTWDRNDAGDNAAKIYVDGQQLLSVIDDSDSFSFSTALQIGHPLSGNAGGLSRVSMAVSSTKYRYLTVRRRLTK